MRKKLLRDYGNSHTVWITSVNLKLNRAVLEFTNLLSIGN